jgi:hypothetical protein
MNIMIYERRVTAQCQIMKIDSLQSRVPVGLRHPPRPAVVKLLTLSVT